MDATVINKKVRLYLLEQGIDNDDLYINLPFYNEGYWYVGITDIRHDRLFGTVILTKEGDVIVSKSYPKNRT